MTCKKCGKPNWAGCGAHVEMVLADVPKAQRCKCREGGPVPRPTTKAAATAAATDASAVGRFKDWLRR